MRLSFFPYILLCGMLLLGHIALSQELVLVKNKVNGMTEEFQVLKSDRAVRHGTYELSSKFSKHVIGWYEHGIRSGRWVGIPEKEPYVVYNYSTRKLEYHRQLRSESVSFADSLTQGDVVTASGTVYPIYQYVEKYMSGFPGYLASKGQYTAEMRINIDENNTVTSAELGAKGYTNLYSKKVKIDQFKDLFFSATINGEPVKSTLVIEMFRIVPQLTEPK